MNAPASNQSSAALAFCSKLAVLMAFWLIFVGGHTTTSGAGMAFPDWPLSHGSLNPEGWWSDIMMRLEHGHRLSAGLFGLLVGVLCAWIWRSKAAVPVSLLGAVGIGAAAAFLGMPRGWVALIGITSSAVLFAILLLRATRKDRLPRPGAIRWLAFAAFVGVFAQAVLGGLRVILDPEGIAATDVATATTFRVLHGCFAQVELCLLVALAALLSPVWARIAPNARLAGLTKLSGVAVGAVFLQLVVGATMRHLGAGLAISTYPHANARGGWLPDGHNLFVDLNFTHTRVGAVIVTLLLLHLAAATWRKADGDAAFVRPAILLGALIFAQFALGVLVIWNLRPPMLTTLHVVNGAAVLATLVLLAVRLNRAAGLTPNSKAFAAPRPLEAVV